MTKYWYSNEYTEWVEIDVNSPYRTPDAILEGIAEDAAEDYYSNVGFDDEWPMIFHIKDESGPLGSVSVELEFNPYFWGSKIND